MEKVRREALIQAAIAEIGKSSAVDVTVSQIAQAAGMSSALAHHYFGSKDQMFLATMRHMLAIYGDEMRAAMAGAGSPQARLEALLVVSFNETNFRRDVLAAWLNFCVMAQRDAQAARLLRLYQARLRSNLRHALRPLAGSMTASLAEGAAAMIDGIYLREALGKGQPDGPRAVEQVRDWMHMVLLAPSDRD